MITGEVISNEAVVTVALLDGDGCTMTIRFAIDTGFTGHLTLPSDTIARMGLERIDTVPARLADGSRILTRVYLITIVWDDDEREIPVYEANGGPLLGMLLLRGFCLTANVIDGGAVTITRLH